MSVAFRRESDEEHKEPRFEIPIPVGPNIVTARGLALTQARLAEMEAAVAAETDALRMAELQRDLRYWRTRAATAEIAPPPPADEAGFGSRVRFRLNGEERSIDIVGDDEADPAEGRIAFSAPLALALIGAGDGDRVDFAGAEEAIEVLGVSAIPEDQPTLP